MARRKRSTRKKVVPPKRAPGRKVRPAPPPLPKPAGRVRCVVNGKPVDEACDSATRLLAFLRERLGLGSVREGCARGECGACTVLVDGRVVPACLMLACQANGTEITTVEGLAEAERLHVVQTSLLDESESSCGFCVPGLLLSAKALVDGNPSPSSEEIRLQLAGHLCPTTSCAAVERAVLRATRDVYGHAGDTRWSHRQRK
ncbi:MAG: 2Fe-2S iron-sulfur cluster binding domain-containing protein [Planctomycetes bacterium]|nr:2Fe-2S iron-sulfur cluster binding domain-containing protein [Planctomycetota bacterium]